MDLDDISMLKRRTGTSSINKLQAESYGQELLNWVPHCLPAHLGRPGGFFTKKIEPIPGCSFSRWIRIYIQNYPIPR